MLCKSFIGTALIDIGSMTLAAVKMIIQLLAAVLDSLFGLLQYIENDVSDWKVVVNAQIFILLISCGLDSAGVGGLGVPTRQAQPLPW